MQRCASSLNCRLHSRCNFIRKFLQSRPRYLVIITAQRIAGKECLVAIADYLPTGLRRRHIVHADRNAPQCCPERVPLAEWCVECVFRHIIHFAVVALVQPLLQPALRWRRVGVGIGDADLLEPQFSTPDLDCLGKPGKVWSRAVFR